MYMTRKVRMCIVVCLSGFLLTNALQPIQAQDVTTTDGVTEEIITDNQEAEQVNELDIEAVIEPEADEPTLIDTNAETVAESHPDVLTNSIFLPTIQGGASKLGAGETDEVVTAFQQSPWTASCTNVVAAERGLWDDMPGAGVGGDNNEAGLLWFLTNQIADEKCSYSSDTGNVDTDDFPSLRVRVAVNDGAIFKVEVYDNTVAPCAGLIAPNITTGASHAMSNFRTFQVNLPPNRLICKVKITLDDNPDNITSPRASALIDYLRIWNPANNGIGWNESFTHFIRPPECQTSQLLLPAQLTQPADMPYWQFVLNFDIWQGNQPIACVVLYHQGDRMPFDAIRFPCELKEQVVRNNFAVQFNGGYVQCPINLQQRIASLGDPLMVLHDTYDYPAFTVAGAGLLRAEGPINEPFSNPIIVYQPTDSNRPSVGLFTPLRSLHAPPLKVQIVSRYGNVARPNNPNGCPFFISDPASVQRWYMTLGANTVAHWLNNQHEGLPCNFANQPPIRFWTTGGTFFIGGLPAVPPSRLRGELDEVVIDPTGSTKPPS